MRRLLSVVAVSAAVLMGLSGVASAGEVKGAPSPSTGSYSTPVATWPVAHRNSICAFSGLEDYNNSQPPTPGVVQTPAEGDPGDAAVCSMLNYGKMSRNG
jgi:hypothetical protein